MPGDDHKNMKKIQCWIPLATWEKVEALGITSPTIAVTKAFDLLLKDPHVSSEDPRQDSQISLEIPEVSQYISEDPRCIPYVSPEIPELKAIAGEQKTRIENYKAQVQTLNAEISRLKNTIMEAPDPIELVKLQERNEGLNMLIEEKNRSIERLEKEVNRLDLFSHYFKSDKTKMIETPAAADKKKPWWKVW
jgi:predicted RNase H-like nuclease (RuvC/YqgF family)